MIMTPVRLYVGTFTHARTLPVGPEQGIFWYQFDPQNGQLVYEGAADAGPDPYAVNEVAVFRGHAGGGVSAFSVDRQSGTLTFLNCQPSFGVSPCFISLDKTGKWVMVSNYIGGNLSVYPILSRGTLGPASDFVQHVGHGPNPDRQEKPHAHSIQTDPSNRLVLAADLGLDQVKLYQLDLAAGKLVPAAEEALNLHPGAGPRHLDFHPSGQWLYVLNELDSTLAVFKRDGETASFRHLQTVSSLPDGYSGEKWAADLHVHINGKFVFVSNRAHDSLASFAIDPQTGRVSLISVAASGGRTPRNFAIDPSGRWLLTATGIEVSLPNPVCIKFAP
jgi:6-phosphogluconolactonase